MSDFDRVKTYKQDAEILKTLGLEPFDIECGVLHYIGKYQYPCGSFIKLWVKGLPAQFYTAEIYVADLDKNYKVETGLGCLADYWKQFENVALGCFVVRFVEPEHSCPPNKICLCHAGKA